jgi:hypothetical protein
MLISKAAFSRGDAGFSSLNVGRISDFVSDGIESGAAIRREILLHVCARRVDSASCTTRDKA